MAAEMVRICKRCAVEKHIADFRPHRHSCKACERQEHRAWLIKNAGHVISYKRTYHDKHKNEERTYRIKRYWENREECLLKTRAYSRSEKGRAAFAKFRQTEKGHANMKRGRAKRRSLFADMLCTLTAEDWANILQEHDFRCAYCGRSFSDVLRPTQDHVVPISLGGNHAAENIVPACASCNSSKGNRPLKRSVA